jgi:hypothetical protein
MIGTLIIAIEDGDTVELTAPGIPTIEFAPVSGTTALTFTGVSGPTGERGERGDRGEKGDRGEQGERGDTGLSGRDYDPADIAEVRADIAAVEAATQTMATSAGYNFFQAPQAINALNLNNSPALYLANVGGGTSGILFGRASGGDLMIGAQEAGFWGFYSSNRSYLFRASDRAFDGSPQAFDWDNSNAASRDVMRLRHSGAAPGTGSFITFADNALATVGKIDSTAKFWGSGANFKPGAAPATAQDGDIWTTPTGMFIRIAGVTMKVSATPV